MNTTTNINLHKLTPVSASDSNTIVCRADKRGSVRQGPKITLIRHRCGFDVHLRIEIELGQTTICAHDAPFTQAEKTAFLALYDEAALAEDRRRETIRRDALHILRELGVF
jgi:hypothetical protein